MRKLLEDIAAGRVEPREGVERLRRLPFESTGEATIDHHRALRCGFPEVIFGEGKTDDQMLSIFNRLAQAGADVLATRVTPTAAAAVLATHPDAHHHRTARALTLRRSPPAPQTGGYVGIVAAGTSDLPVAEEARVTAEIMGARVQTLYDVGVAGLHRLLARSRFLREADVLVVAAGMEGALPSVVGGLVEAPVIAVPTSVGYGASFGGVAALLG
ncbi:MAG: nickel pincer cofactor biosynthesis protein LarB, partial [Planctomycetota bacterium]